MFRFSTYALTLMAALGGASATQPPSATSSELEPSNRVGPTPEINLGVAGTFAILSKAGITDVFESYITGNVGTSPISGTALGLQCGEVHDSEIYTVDAYGPDCSFKFTDPSHLTTAIGDMGTAYTQAAGVSGPDYTELEGGNICGLTLPPGVYKWSGDVLISDDITIEGSSDERWIFQIAGTLTLSPGKKINLSNGAQANNIVWQAAESVTLGTNSHFEGVILTQTAINMYTGASLNGHLFAHTAVTLQQNDINKPQSA